MSEPAALAEIDGIANIESIKAPAINFVNNIFKINTSYFCVLKTSCEDMYFIYRKNKF
jgi:hypothetical protein